MIKSPILTKIVGDACDSIAEPIESLITECEEMITGGCAPTDDQMTKVEAICDWTWERLNVGKYANVDVNVRKVYAYAHLLKCLLLLATQLETICFAKAVDALHCLDRSLMVHGSLGHSLLLKIASELHRILKEMAPTLKPDDLCHHSTLWLKLQSNLPTFSENQLIIADIPFLAKPDSYPIDKVSNIDLNDFANKYLKPKVPVIITDAIDHWPCRSSRRWSLAYLLDQCAFRLVPIEVGSKYTEESWSQKLMTVQDFVHDYIIEPKKKEIGYLAQHFLFDQIKELANDYSVPDFCALPTDDVGEEDEDDIHVDVNAWFGPGGTVSPLHTDPKDNLFVQVLGSKFIRLYSSETPAEQIYPHDSNLLNNTSMVNIEDVDQENFPNFKLIDTNLIYECVLNEGEMLYIPKKFWHFVKSLSMSFSLSFWWR